MFVVVVRQGLNQKGGAEHRESKSVSSTTR